MCHMQLKNVACNYILVTFDTCSYIGQVAKNIFSIDELALCTLWAFIDAIHTLIDMVCTMLLLCMPFCMKITLLTNVHPNLLYYHQLTWST
jgi:hypothetical protein